MWWEVWASQVALVVKNLPANAGEIRFPGRGHDNPLEYSCLENPMDCRLQSITSYSQTQLKRLGTQATKSLVVKSPRGELMYLCYKEGPQSFLFPFCNPQFVVSPDGGAISCLQLKVSCSYVTVAKQKRRKGGKQTFSKKCIPRSLCNTYLLISLLKIGQHACPSDISLTKGLRSPWWMYLPTQRQGTFGKEGGWVLGIKIFI